MNLVPVRWTCLGAYRVAIYCGNGDFTAMIDGNRKHAAFVSVRYSQRSAHERTGLG